jgi:hypothetical protein
MSEVSASYSVAGKPMITLEAFRGLPCSLLFADPGYSRPTPGEVDALIRAAGWSQNDAARIVGVSFGDKGSTTIRKWRAPLQSAEYREIPYSAWRLMLIYAGVVER